MSDDPKMEVQTQSVNGVPHAKVRIPVAINSKGEWITMAAWNSHQQVARDRVLRAADELGFKGAVVHWVYALVPIPTSEIIWGEAET